MKRKKDCFNKREGKRKKIGSKKKKLDQKRKKIGLKKKTVVSFWKKKKKFIYLFISN